MTTTPPHFVRAVRERVAEVVVGQDVVVERMLIALLTGGHLLLLGVPGTAKTLLVNTVAKAVALKFGRVQFTIDMLPSDILGSELLDQASGSFRTHKGPVFTNLLLADEINRAPAKVQSALLEVMQERQVTIAGQTHPLPRPFVVMATQNPIETEGTYPLPEAQIDRFMMKVRVGYPTEEEEFVIVQRMTGAALAVQAVCDTDELVRLQALCRQGYVDPALVQFAVRLVAATREPARFGLPDMARQLSFGASPRATIGLIEGARALAFLRGRPYALPQDLIDLVPDVLRHRLVLSYEALAEGVQAEQLIARLLQAVPAPSRPLATHVDPLASPAL